ncbi:MAG TPA: hypothetical protein VK503_04450 [Candidatus Bathyarchaeia archaeon]|nr:hypothetical protein [Candidatus Bathyarchaeia archaeon]
MEPAKSKPKASFSSRLPNGDFLHVAVWAGKSDPTAEVLAVDIRHNSDGTWTSIGRLALYRTRDGIYSQLPERSPPMPRGTEKNPVTS